MSIMASKALLGEGFWLTPSRMCCVCEEGVGIVILLETVLYVGDG